jgi:hypothetical protein
MRDRLLRIYVEDHVALSLGGLRLARRCSAENGEGELGRFLAKLVEELAEDRQTLLDLAALLELRPSVVKQAALAAGELAGRLKANGRLLGYSDLSRLWELEALLAGSRSRYGMWRLLERVGRRDPRFAGLPLERLRDRAEGHVETLERFRMRAGEQAFLGGARIAAGEAAESSA